MPVHNLDPNKARREYWLDWVDNQTDQSLWKLNRLGRCSGWSESLPCTHYFVGFVMLCLIFYVYIWVLRHIKFISLFLSTVNHKVGWKWEVSEKPRLTTLRSHRWARFWPTVARLGFMVLKMADNLQENTPGHPQTVLCFYIWYECGSNPA